MNDVDGQVCEACGGKLRLVGAVLPPDAATWLASHECGTGRSTPLGFKSGWHTHQDVHSQALTEAQRTADLLDFLDATSSERLVLCFAEHIQPIKIGFPVNPDTDAEDMLDDLTTRDGDRKPEVVFTGFGESSIDLVLRVWLQRSDQKCLLRARSEAIIAVKKAFDDADITIPFPIRTLDFGGGAVGGRTVQEMKPKVLADAS